MFVLKNSNGETQKMKDGTPFTYSTRDLAHRGKVLLENQNKVRLSVVPV